MAGRLAGFAFERRPIRLSSVRDRDRADADGEEKRPARARPRIIQFLVWGGRSEDLRGTVSELSFVSQQQTPLQIVIEPSQL